MYVVVLRAIDDAIRALSTANLELAGYLLIDALDGLALADAMCGNQHRNTEHLFVKVGLKIEKAAARVAIRQHYRDIGSNPRPDDLTAPIDDFVRQHPSEGWKPLLTFLIRHPSFKSFYTVEDMMEWVTLEGSTGQAPVTGLPSRLTRARRKTT